MRLPRPLQRAFDLLVPELRRISDAVGVLHSDLQQQIKSVDAEQERQEQQKHIAPLWANEIVTRCDQAVRDIAASDDRHYAVQKSLKRAAWCTFIATALAFGAAAYYARVARLQWETMQQTYMEIKKQTTQITNQTTTLRQQIIGADAAVINTSFDVGGLKCFFNLFNTGQVSAIHTNATIQVARVAIPSGTPIGKPTVYTISEATVVHSGNRQTEVPCDQSWISRDYIEAGSIPRYSLKVYASYTYNNGFGDIISGDYCRIWLPPFKVATKYSNTINGGGMESCKDFRHEFEWVVKSKQDQAEGKSPPPPP